MNTGATRKEKVLAFLTWRKGQWVNGPDLANEEVGGSEGLKRLRELRAEGYRIEQRRHPDPERDIWQYMLRDIPTVSPLRPVEPDPEPMVRCPDCGHAEPVRYATPEPLAPGYVTMRCPTDGRKTVRLPR